MTVGKISGVLCNATEAIKIQVRRRENIFIYICIYIYIYICVCVCVCVYTYIYIYIAGARRPKPPARAPRGIGHPAGTDVSIYVSMYLPPSLDNLTPPVVSPRLNTRPWKRPPNYMYTHIHVTHTCIQINIYAHTPVIYMYIDRQMDRYVLDVPLGLIPQPEGYPEVNPIDR